VQEGEIAWTIQTRIKIYMTNYRRSQFIFNVHYMTLPQDTDLRPGMRCFQYQIQWWTGVSISPRENVTFLWY